MARKSKIEQKAEDIRHLDAATQAIIKRMNKSDKGLRVTGFLTIVLLLGVGVVGILYQNHYALQNKKHIDCIIKDLATPQPPGTQHKYITELSTNCNIKFT